MAPSDQAEFLLPLFPLPNLVFFPKTVLPLHVFEPRYRQLVLDVLDSDSRFGIVLLEPGWEADYHGAPPIHEFGTVGIIEQSIPLDDGRFNIVLRGQSRIRIIDEFSRVPYRTARVVLDPDEPIAAEQVERTRSALQQRARDYLRFIPDQSFPNVGELDLETLTHMLISSLNLDFEENQRLLELRSLADRAEQVARELESRTETLRFLAPYRRDGDPARN